ncbi:hypothetical protein C0099_13540 [Pseudazoarcus pumilus]|uniref:SMODS and SLOG-associating 2TM effector domain-containing protein n=2 Tax=Pseudazoarcus pumilus TaxID=2067960 RepID=A0A2I6S9D1_9RHOO|nr:hypothetical protein C0099_13540 [Pseudazoarcus pumilus]
MKEAATIQELFDCEVLSLPWRQSVAGRKPEYEDIQPYAATPLRPERESHLKSWYEPCVASVPLVYGRLICQRANICYDIRLRKVYKKLLLWGAVGLTAFAFVIGVATNLAFRDMVLSVFVPVAPMLGWVIREHRSQIETIISLQQLKDAFDELWEKALRGDGDLDIESGARDLQDRIFQHRTNNPLIFDWIYDLLRKENEDGTRAAAEQLVGQVQRVLNKESAA